MLSSGRVTRGFSDGGSHGSCVLRSGGNAHGAQSCAEPQAGLTGR